MYTRFKQKNFKTWTKEIADKAGVKASNSFILFPEQIADGYFFADSIDRSFSFVVMNAELKENFTFHRISNNQQGLLIFFNLIEVADFFGIRSKKNSIIDTCRYRNNIFVSSSNMELELSFTAGTKMKRIGIYLSPQWIAGHFDADTKMQIEMLTNLDLDQINKLLITDEMQEKLSRIFETNFNKESEKLALKSRIIILLEYFFSAYINDSLQISNKKIIPDEDIIRLQNVEELLKNEELERFPSISNLARIAHMSSTKLKQRFKQVYGLRLYEFYNKRRLNKAKEMMLKGISAKEAGFSIGFTDVSNFTKAFKREYGCTPKNILEREYHSEITNTISLYNKKIPA
jgi:AraC-like DNA-binding protein